MFRNEAALRELLRETLNRLSIDNELNTPDFILADYLIKCLHVLDDATRERDRLRESGVTAQNQTGAK